MLLAFCPALQYVSTLIVVLLTQLFLALILMLRVVILKGRAGAQLPEVVCAELRWYVQPWGLLCMVGGVV